MSITRAPRRSPDQWFDLITEARQSGLTDREWCRRNSINHYSFSNAIKRLRRRACGIPEHSRNELVDLTNAAPAIQEVVKVGIQPESCPQVYAAEIEAPNHKSCPAIEISLPSASIVIYDSASPALVSSIVEALGAHL